MKKLFLFSAIAFSSAAFSQSVKLSSDGKSAVKVTPAAPATETAISLQELKDTHETIANQIAQLQKELANLQAQEKQYADLIKQLDK